ncbi:unnamed protein product, partial [Trichogramma brassicae]
VDRSNANENERCISRLRAAESNMSFSRPCTSEMYNIKCTKSNEASIYDMQKIKRDEKNCKKEFSIWRYRQKTWSIMFSIRVRVCSLWSTYEFSASTYFQDPYLNTTPGLVGAETGKIKSKMRVVYIPGALDCGARKTIGSRYAAAAALMNHRSKPQKPRTGLPRSTSKRISCNSNKYSRCLLILYLCTSTACCLGYRILRHRWLQRRPVMFIIMSNINICTCTFFFCNSGLITSFWRNELHAATVTVRILSSSSIGLGFRSLWESNKTVNKIMRFARDVAAFIGRIYAAVAEQQALTLKSLPACWRARSHFLYDVYVYTRPRRRKQCRANGVAAKALPPSIRPVTLIYVSSAIRKSERVSRVYGKTFHTQLAKAELFYKYDYFCAWIVAKYDTRRNTVLRAVAQTHVRS